jgi:hypothetical protein
MDRIQRDGDFDQLLAAYDGVGGHTGWSGEAGAADWLGVALGAGAGQAT